MNIDCRERRIMYHPITERNTKLKKLSLKTTVLLLVLGLCALMSVSVSAAGKKLSPALDNISYQSCMIKSGGFNGAVRFDKNDFYDHIGADFSSVKITSLPPENEGVLMLGSTTVKPGQTISRLNLGLLRFLPSANTADSVFEFCSDGNYPIECHIKLSDSTGSAPVASGAAMTTVTQSDVTCFGELEGYDEDGDILMFEIVSYPENGLLELVNTERGSFTYTPYDGFDGIDSFSYRIRDTMGHYSDECEVSLKIIERDSEIELADMDGHWAHSAALSAVSGGFMNALEENGSLYFSPNDTVSREEFLVSVMRGLGAGELDARKTIFADDSEISVMSKGYVEAARQLGIIEGVETALGRLFLPKEPITLAEASVILNRILGLEVSDEIKDIATSVPVWAEKDISALSSVGIVTVGEADSSKPLTKAEVAHIIYVTNNLIEE